MCSSGFLRDFFKTFLNFSYFVQSLKSRIDCSKVLAGHKVKDVSPVSFTYRTVRGETVFRCQIPNESDVLQRLFFFVLWEKSFLNPCYISLNCTHVIIRKKKYYTHIVLKLVPTLVAYCSLCKRYQGHVFYLITGQNFTTVNP